MRPSALPLLPVLVLVACGGAKGDGDTAATEDSGGTDAAAATFAFALDGSVDGAALGVFALDPMVGLEPGEMLVAGAAGDRVAEVPRFTPTAAQLVPFPEDTALSFAMYVPLLWQDTDGDLVRDAGEAFLGSGAVVLAYFSDVNDDLRAEGFQPGWNYLRMHMDDSRPTVLGAGELRMPLNLVVAPSVTLRGVADQTVGEGARIAALASSGTSAPEAVIASVDATDTWTLTIEGAPETVPLGPFLQLRATRGLFGLLAAWTDTDASGGYTDDDALLPLCVQGGTEPMSVAAMWVDPVMDGADALFLGFAGLGAGWRAVATTGDVFVPLADGTGLTASATCFTGPA